MNDDEKDRLRSGRYELMTDNIALVRKTKELDLELTKTYDVLYGALKASNRAAQNLNDVQKRCTDLFYEVRYLRALLFSKGTEEAEIESWLAAKRSDDES